MHKSLSSLQPNGTACAGNSTTKWHINRGLYNLCEGSKRNVAARLVSAIKNCPFSKQRLYFETTLAVVQIASKRFKDARQLLTTLSVRQEIQIDERVALKLMQAHVDAVEGDLDAARSSLEDATKVVSFEPFRLRRLRQEVENRFGLGSNPSPSSPDEIAASDKTLIGLETGFWIDCATQTAANMQLAA